MITKEVAISGTIGKQVYYVASGAVSAGTRSIVLRGLSTYGQTSAVSVTVKNGNASGTTIISHTTPAGDSAPLILPGRGIRFDNGMHVKVLGKAASVCYLFID